MYFSNFRKKGFTLIELLVVISIISLLSSVVLSSLGTARARARDAKRMQDLAQINTAVQLYILDNGEAPVPGRKVTSSDGYLWDEWLGETLSPYITTLPLDPCPTCEAYQGRNPDGYINESSAAGNSRDLRYIYAPVVEWHTDCLNDGGCDPSEYILDLSGFETRPKTQLFYFNFQTVY